MTKTATGPFDVKMTPIALADANAGPLMARFSLDKAYHGALQGTAKGEMLSAGTAVKSSAGYVALEKVEATLDGKSGTFALQHNGTMNRGQYSLTITVVPDSGTGELAGLTGNMSIDVSSGHAYTLEYSLPD